MIHLLTAGLMATVAGVIYFLYVLYQKRRQLDGWPCPPMKNWLLGHLPIAADCQNLFPPDVHPQIFLDYIQKTHGQDDCFYLDWWPLGPRWLVISDPEIASQYVTTGASLPKSSLIHDYLNTFLGDKNFIVLEGQEWKTLRSVFNPGFSSGHLMTLTEYIVDAGLIFHQVICEKAKTNEVFELEEYATRLTIDIIGKVVLDSDFDSQKATHPIVEAFRERVLLMPRAGALMNLAWFEFPRRFKLWQNGRQLDRLIGEELDRKLAGRQTHGKQTKSIKERKRSVIDLALDAYANQQAKSSVEDLKAPRAMDKAFRTAAIDSMKTFVFAGHDTTASTISYVFYLLHFHPEVHKRLVAELDQVFFPGASTVDIAKAIKADPFIINKLEYVTAVLKETLRLFTPASTLRALPEQSDPSKRVYITHPRTGQKLRLDGFNIWPAASHIGRNKRFFPKPAHFIPERFIPTLTPFPYPQSELHTPAGKDAWRPFEKGPRNCIGQELAMIEMKIMLAMLVKDLDFVVEIDGEKVESWTPIEMHEEFRDGKPGSERMTVEGHRVFQILKGSAKPRGGMPGRMSFREEST